MQLFQNLPIKRKLLLLNLIICGAVLIVAMAAMFVFQVVNFRANVQRDTATLAAVIANNSTAALAFNDTKGANEVINSLKAKPTVVCACLVKTDGAVLAHFGEIDDSNELAQFPPAGEFRYVRGQMLYTESVKLDGKRVGALLLRVDYWDTFMTLVGFYALLIGGVTGVSVLLAAFLSGKLGRVITLPVLQLAQTAQAVGEKKDYSLRAALTNRGDELGRLTNSFNEMLDRIQTQDSALSLSQQKMEAMIHSIDGIVWECEPDTLRFTFVSRQSERLLGYTAEEWLADPNFWAEKLHPEDKLHAIRTHHDMVDRQLPFNFEYRLLAKDGRTVWIRESGVVLAENRRAVAVRGIFQDISDQKASAEELEKLNRKLVETSRQAGMAEVATGVLHNVGNVLNSVSVSATLVSDRLRQSKATRLQRATNLLREKDGQLAEFLTTDPKGKLLPEYFSVVADQLVAEQAQVVAEMNSVGQHIEHIKEIVAMQQSYAKVSGAFENLSPAELVEDALRMNAAAFERHAIEVIREFQKHTSMVCVDRHKVLQILINLIRNAKYAMEARGIRDKRLVVRVGLAGQGRVGIEICDNGIGISPGNLVKIFNHGFTTKKDGHGFGLHSGANAAKEMGGCLSAHSDGIGHGARFILELPIAVEARNKVESPSLMKP